ncbi:MAG: N-acetyltransferase [Betaproteobacteria bacterium]|nr:N-acetyltransferase [Betaproteobacteria bacterium]
MSSSAVRPYPSYRGARINHPASPADFSIRQVASVGERLATEQLVRRMYSWRGYRVAAPKHKADDNHRLTLGAWRDGELAATLTMTVDRGQGLLCEELYPGEIAALRNDDRRLCEYSRFAIDPEFSSQKLLRAFFLSAYHLACRILEATHAVIEVNPRHRRFYERELGFSGSGTVRICPRVEAPALLLYRDLRQFLPEMLRGTLLPLADLSPLAA